MSGSNADDDNRSPGNPKQTLLNATFGEYRDDVRLPCPTDELEKWKRKLEHLRSKTDDTSGTRHKPLRRPANGEPLHIVFKNIMNGGSACAVVDGPADRGNVIPKRPDHADGTSSKGTATSDTRPAGVSDGTSSAGKTRETGSRAECTTKPVRGRTTGGPPMSGQPSKAKRTGEMNAKPASGRRGERSGPRKDFETRTDVASSKDAAARLSTRRTAVRKTAAAAAADVSSSKRKQKK